MLLINHLSYTNHYLFTRNLRKYVRNNTVFDKPKEFRDKLDNFFNKIKSEVNDNFHILNLGFKT